MAYTPVSWDPNRIGSVKQVLKRNASTGAWYIDEQQHNYSGVTYNFAPLTSGSTTQAQTGTTQAQTGTTSAQTTKAFGDVTPQFAQHDNEDPFSASFSKDKTMTDANTMGFTLDKANQERAEMVDANVGHEAFDKSNLASDLPERDMDKFRARFDQTYKDKWVEDTESNPRGSTYSGFILKSEADRIKREREAKLDKMRKVPIIGSRLAAGSEFIRNIIPREWRSTDTQKFNKQHFTAYTSGSMAGRITGDKGDYDPANNLYHGMNRTSAYGNIERAGQKRIDRINKTIAKKKAKGQDTTTLEKE